ncbi:glycoside hydrolase family 6 protein [Streptomyces sp. CA-179760]|uniref:glycoside hydrolase family 6 protein n=1 Tax=Streptomyces sp. CA-179760 TaxID=3240054 RepID=UPI003D90A883
MRWTTTATGNQLGPKWQASTGTGQAGGIAHVQGFAVNIANFDAVDVCCAYATEITTGLTRLGVPGTGVVMDTSRNGNGAMDTEGQHVEWCNPAGRRLGVPSSIGVGGADHLL